MFIDIFSLKNKDGVGVRDSEGWGIDSGGGAGGDSADNVIFGIDEKCELSSSGGLFDVLVGGKPVRLLLHGSL